MSQRRLDPRKVDQVKWDEYLERLAELRKEENDARIEVEQADGSKISVIPFELIRKRQKLDEEFEKLFKTWWE
ncbi:MAG: hypothetical protein PVH24_01010 [Candidatus Zixiibacteriota bacterium]|jgi:hypothetical protein